MEKSTPFSCLHTPNKDKSYLWLVLISGAQGVFYTYWQEFALQISNLIFVPKCVILYLISFAPSTVVSKAPFVIENKEYRR